METVSFSRKFTVGFLTGLNIMYAVFELWRKVLPEYMDQLSFVCFSAFGISMLFIVIWQYREKRNLVDSQKIFGLWLSALCYAIALDLCMFAWRKIFHLQFDMPLGWMGKRLDSFTGEQLTIAYFSHSYVFGLCIAMAQLSGSFLLLFRKTRLLGAFVLLPVVVNIILIDTFFEVAFGALLQAIAINFGLLYILCLERNRIVNFFFRTMNPVAEIGFGKKLFKNGIRISALVIPMAICIFLSDFPNSHPELRGKYEVSKLTINNKEIPKASCNDSTLTAIYVERQNLIVFENNSPERLQVAHFEFDETSRKMKAIWRFPKDFHDTLSVKFTIPDKQNELMLYGIMGRDTIRVRLKKVL